MNSALKAMLSAILLMSALTANAQTGKKWSVEQIKEMSNKYGTQDILTEKDIDFLTNKDKSFIDDYLKTRRDFEDREMAVRAFRKKTIAVRTAHDYFVLIENNPAVRKIESERLGGEAGYQAHYADLMKHKHRIYRDKNGVLTFIRANAPVSEEEQDGMLGGRIDNLPRS